MAILFFLQRLFEQCFLAKIKIKEFKIKKNYGTETR